MADNDDTPTGETIPLARFQQVVNERNALREEVTGLKTKAGEYTTQLAEWQTKYTTLEQKASHDVGLASLGLTDPSGREIVSLLWDRMDKDARGASPVEWVHGQLKEGGTLHPALQGYLGGTASGSQPAPPTPAPPAPPAPPAGQPPAGVPAGTNGGASPGPAWDHDKGLNGMSLEQYRAQRAQVLGTKA